MLEENIEWLVYNLSNKTTSTGPGDAINVSVSINTSGLSGSYIAVIEIISNAGNENFTIAFISNSAPTANNDTALTDEDIAIIINVSANDNDPDENLNLSSISIVENPRYGIVAPNANGTVMYIPNIDYYGTDSFRYTIKDIYGFTSNIATVNVTINDVNDAPVANFTYLPENPTTADVIYFNASSSYDPDGEIVNYTWDFGDGNVSYEQNPTHRYIEDGIYNVNLTVTDNDGASSTITKQISVGNTPPIANFSYSPTDPKVGDIICFNASSSHDPDGEIVNYTWDFGDGNVSYGEIVTHAYSSAGIYNVTLTVRDDVGAENSTTLQIHIAINDTNPPSITIQKPQSYNLYILGRAFKFLLPNPWVIGKLEVKVNAGDKSGIEKVEFYLDGKLKYTDTSYPYSYTFKERSFGKLHTIKIKAYDTKENSASKEIKVRWFCLGV